MSYLIVLSSKNLFRCLVFAPSQCHIGSSTYPLKSYSSILIRSTKYTILVYQFKGDLTEARHCVDYGQDDQLCIVGLELKQSAHYSLEIQKLNKPKHVWCHISKLYIYSPNVLMFYIACPNYGLFPYKNPHYIYSRSVNNVAQKKANWRLSVTACHMHTKSIPMLNFGQY